MELDEAILKRRSVRRFIQKPVEPEKIRKIIEAGVNAPSACNVQGWRFKILTESEKNILVDAGGADFVKRAPTVLVVVYPATVNNYRDELQSAAACIQNMLLKATDLGLGSCWVCHLPPMWIVRRMLEIPANYEVIGCVVFGYPKSEPKTVKRKNRYEELFRFEDKSKSLKDYLKYFYTRQPFRPKIIEKIFPKRFDN